MDSTQIAILIGATAAQAIAVALPYWVGRQSGQRAGLEAARQQLSADLAFLRNRHAMELRRHLEEIAALKLELSEARAQSDQHARLLRDAVTTIRLVCAGWEAMGATHKARECRPQAGDLERLAARITPGYVASKEALHA